MDKQNIQLAFFSTDSTKVIQCYPSFVMFPFLLFLHAAASHSWQFTVAHMLQLEIPVLNK
jgi:hypothetical protein